MIKKKCCLHKSSKRSIKSWTNIKERKKVHRVIQFNKEVSLREKPYSPGPGIS